jgi:hypothetical protein
VVIVDLLRAALRNPTVVFLLGLASGLLLVAAWHAARFLLDLRAARRRAEAALDAATATPRDREARRLVELSKRKLRFQPRLNPRWVAPLIEEIPVLVRAIAVVYYPDHPDPLRAPGLSRFTRAVELGARDVAEFLETRRVGRLIDMSAAAAWRTWDVGRRVTRHEHVRSVVRWYDRLRPVWQATRYRSPVMWTGLAASNAAIRVLQPEIIEIVARRAIELYSGRATPAEGPPPG